MRVAKVPVIMQLEALECGAASLCMILAYYGLWIPLEQLRKDCGVSRDGSNLKNVNLAARKYNLNPKAFKCSAEKLREIGTFPCIAYWEGNHFLVVDGFKGKYVYLNDPARGEVKITFEEFQASYSGICMLCEPTEEFAPSGRPSSILKFAAQRLAGTLPMIALVVITTLIASLTGILMPAFSRFFVDKLLTGKAEQWSAGFFVLLGLVIMFQVVSLSLKAVYLLKLRGKMAVIANSSFLWHILRLPVEFFEQRMAGDIVQRQQSNSVIAETLIQTFTPLLLDGAAMCFNLLIMIDYSPMLACAGLLSVCVNLLLARIIAAKRVNITRVQMRDLANLNSTTLMGIDMIETIKSSGAEEGFFAKWAGYYANSHNQQVKFMKLEHTLGQLPSLVSLLASNIILYLGVSLVMSGDWTIGLISAFNGYLLSFSTPANMLILAGQQLQEMRTNMERVQDVFKYPVHVQTSVTVPDEEMNKLSGLVEMKHITFGYNKLERPLLEDFSLRVEPGGSVALVGSSGCGKSTVAKLLTGLYDVWEGQILYDGKELSAINRNIFTGSVASVDQNVTLFEGTIDENIRLWDKSIENFEVILAARDAAVHADILEREGDYSAKILEGGRNFSGGQRQRLEIARVLAQDPTVIILDEATSALDSQTEYRLMQSITARGMTRIIISHRLSIIRDCDEIIVMKDGQILSRGTHEELLKSCDYYVELISNE